MQRRDFLKSAGTAALLLSAPIPFARRASAQQRSEYFWFNIDARGAWDPTSAMDPKGNAIFNSHFTEDDIRVTSTGIRYAPANATSDFMSGPEDNRTRFFERYKEDLVVINGLDTKTNSHDVGPRHVWSGTLRTGSPNFAALMAAIKERSLGRPMPMAMLSTGGFDTTSELFPVARAANPALLRNATVPAQIAATNENNRFLHAESDRLVKAAEIERRNRRDIERLLPAVKRTMQQHWSMRDVETAFAGLNTEIANLAPLTETEADNRLITGAQLAIAGMLSNSCQAAMLSLPGFDTHANHDARHHVVMQDLFDAIDYVARTTRAIGIYDRTIITVASDFGRTIFNGPVGDNSRGKDHWPITSMMALGGPVAGGRTIGLTDFGPQTPGAPNTLKGQRAAPLVVRQGELVASSNDDANAEYLQPVRIHQALRTLAGIEGDPIADQFPLEVAGPVWPIFE